MNWQLKRDFRRTGKNHVRIGNTVREGVAGRRYFYCCFCKNLHQLHAFKNVYASKTISYKKTGCERHYSFFLHHPPFSRARLVRWLGRSNFKLLGDKNLIAVKSLHAILQPLWQAV